MTQDQKVTVSQVFQRFVESDTAERGWSDVDEQMSMLEWLSDGQLAIEASVLLQIQSGGNPQCRQEHSKSACFVPTILEAVGVILDLYGKTSNLHPRNKFILQYYLALSQVGFIVY